ncbi:hypothetical protein ILUMI_24336 [Ignelater luminosus]|uniref:Peptidase S1 domain-containing protein n=1 Tax=Ignelater luminosus TaxID=2038154 RepID=A0A8K0FWL9_IGNLU|nr:hypothetical protein ILUMI_24336 [Ignelater luminosus]
MAILVLPFAATIVGCFGLPQFNNAIQPSPYDDDIQTRIIGGSDAQESFFPYQVSIRFSVSHKHNCGGSILNPTVILTAAHCVHGFWPLDFYVVVGSYLLSNGGVAHAIRQLRAHELYNNFTFKNDIALIMLQSPIQYSINVSPIQLETRYIGYGLDVVLSGWGTTSYPGYFPNNLQYIHLQTISNTRCQRLFLTAPKTFPVFKTALCTLTQSGKGPCKGDSGGPLVYNGKQIGIVSWALPCALGYPDVYTRVSSYIEWIAANARV